MNFRISNGMLFLLILCSVSVHAQTRQGRVFPIFQVVSFNNDPCTTGANLNGTCYTAQECTDRGGTADGTCAESYGVCCLFQTSCGSTLSENNTYFAAPATIEAGECSLKVCKCSNNICQLRLDFNQFNIAAPSTSTVAYAATTGGQIPVAGGGLSPISSSTQCTTDKFMLTNPGGSSPPVICGSNMGSHMYVDASDSCNDMTFMLGQGTVMRMWDIKVTQYSCDYNNLAPTGCTQYYFDTGATGEIKTFNFDGGHHLADQNQVICIRQERNNCRLCVAPANPVNDFAVNAMIQGAGVSLMINAPMFCCGYLPDGAIPMGYDCVIFADAFSTINAVPIDAQVCGGAWTGTASICTRSTPFRIAFRSDGSEVTDPAGGASEAAMNDQGFKLQYTQDATMCTT